MADKNQPDPQQTARIADLEKQLADALRANAVMSGAPGAADLDTFTDGEYVHRASGERYKLKIDKADALGRTHKLKNDEHFYECSEEELRRDFDKV